MAVYNLAKGHEPATTVPGFVIAAASIAIMWALVKAKRRVGRALRSQPILADANCTLACIYMSLVLFASSLFYQFTGIGFADSLGAVGLVYFSIREGRESFAKARGRECACSPDTCGRSPDEEQCRLAGRRETAAAAGNGRHPGLRVKKIMLSACGLLALALGTAS